MARVYNGVVKLERDESLRFAEAFAPERDEAAAWLGRAAAAAEVTVAPPAQHALVDWLVSRLAACAQTALDDERRRAAHPDSPERFARGARGREAWERTCTAFPVMVRLLRASVERWRDAVSGYMAAIARDHARLGARPELAGVRARAGRLGARRPTLITTLAGSSGERGWVYRVDDRDMARWFQELVVAINPALSLPLHARAIHAGDGYSWDAFVPAAGCETAEQRGRFFVRAGMLIRLAERLAAVDLHCENVIAAGEHPVIIDIETLFEAEVPEDAAGAALVASPVRAGLIGSAGFAEPGMRAVSRTGFHPGGELVMPRAAWRLAPLDGPVGGLTLVHPVEQVAPTVPAPIADHVEAVLAGYDEMERVLAVHPALPEMLAAAPALHVRVLGTGGAIHDEALHRSLEASLLRDEVARERYLATTPLSREERAAVSVLELPRHKERVGDRPATRAQPALTTRELARRHDLIRTAVALSDDRPPSAAPAPLAPASFTAHAVALGDFLLAVRFTGGDWHAAVWVPWAGARVLQVAGPDLLSGKAGFALVLAHLFHVTQLARFREAALAALEDVPGPAPYASIGGYVGLGGSCYARARCAELLGAPRLADDARGDLLMLPASALAASHDLVLGAAGLALATGSRAAVDALARADAPTWLLPGGYPAWVPSTEQARALARHRAGEAPSPLDVHALATLPLAWRPDAPADAIADALATPADLLDDVDLALAGVQRAPGDPRFAAALADRGARLVERRAETGRWLAHTSVAERHDLSALTGLGGVILALLAADAPAAVRSLRRFA